MKIIFIGAGGFTTPLIARTLVDRATALDLEEVILHDIDSNRLALAWSITQLLLEKEPPYPKFKVVHDLSEYRGKPDAAIISIRPGFEHGRAIDEGISRELGLLANETVGAAGFAFAARAVPEVLDYAAALTRLNPDILLINFTNPAGIVTQALHDEHYSHAIGVCSSAERVRRQAAVYLGKPTTTIEAHVFGLNHLSWMSSLVCDGRDITAELVTNPEFLRISQPWFPAEFILQKQKFLNEYLVFYYFATDTLRRQTAAGETRGHYIEHLNNAFRASLSMSFERGAPKDAMKTYIEYVSNRKGTYAASLLRNHGCEVQPVEHDSYSDIALTALEAIWRRQSALIAVSIPLGADAGHLRSRDVVEISARIENGHVHPETPMSLDAADEALLGSMKRYEHLTLAAISDKSLALALEALDSHPLLRNPTSNRAFLRHIVEAHADTFSSWH